jgi:hypothetical protein
MLPSVCIKVLTNDIFIVCVCVCVCVNSHLVTVPAGVSPLDAISGSPLVQAHTYGGGSLGGGAGGGGAAGFEVGEGVAVCVCECV